MSEREKTGRSVPEVFAAKHKEERERLSSQSGGMFAVLSDVILEEGGVIYGCVFDSKFQAVHVRAEDAKGRNRMRYSKYVQSDTRKTYQRAWRDLKEGRTVLFSGTSCQISGLQSYLALKPDTPGKLLTVDIICHGVPSPLLWQEYLEWERGRVKSPIKRVICRNKRKYGWDSHVVSMQFENGRWTHSKTFPNMFYGHQMLRPSCYRCPYKDIVHPADITIADYWGIEKACPEFADNKGISIVLINNETGRDLFERCRDRIDCVQTDIEDSLQPPMIGPYDPPEDRGEFWALHESGSFTELAKRFGNYSVMKTLIWKLKVFAKYKILKRK